MLWFEPNRFRALIYASGVFAANRARIGTRGTLDPNGRPVYVNAHYHIWRDEWKSWFSELAAAKAPERFAACACDNLEPIREQVTLLGWKGEIVPGICAVPAPGHTPGHMVVAMTSTGERLFYVGNTVPYPLHLEHPGLAPGVRHQAG